MLWFKSRPKSKRIQRHVRKLELELLEPRINTGLSWMPSTGIDITGIISPGIGPYVVAGAIVSFQIEGSGEDWDEDQQPGGGVMWQDEVTFTWSGAQCQVSSDGKSASCQIGTAGTGSIVDIILDADDAAVVLPGEDGSRDDDAIHVSNQKTGIWVTISGSFSGQLDNDDNLSFYGHTTEGGTPLPIDDCTPRTAGPTTPGSCSYGYFSKVELIGTIAPAIPDGTEGFEWRQNVQTLWCRQRNDDSWHEQMNPSEPDSPTEEGGNKQTATKNSKIFMIDAPGVIVGPDADKEIGTYKKSNLYMNFETAVNYNNKPASNLYFWHNVIKLEHGPNDTWINAAAPDAGRGWITPFPAGCAAQP